MPDQSHPEANMRVVFRPGDRVRQRAMPVVSSILWKPLRDSHYVLASIQPDQAGLRQIFAVQSALDRIHRLAHRPSGAQLLGLLLGRRCDCPVTGARYVVIESFEEITNAARDSKAITAALVDRLAHHRGNSSIECVGWCTSSGEAEPHVSSAHAGIHRSLFEEPWPAALIVANGGNSGAFFLHDSRASRWFQAPFYEVGDADLKADSAKPTCVAWPTYLTTETVIPLPPRQPAEAGPPQRVIATPRPVPSRRATRAIVGTIAAGLRVAFLWVYRVSSHLLAKAVGSGGAAARRSAAVLRSSVAHRATGRARKTADREKARVAEAERKERARAAHAERLRVAAAARIERERAEQERAEQERAKRERARGNVQRQAPQPARAATVQPALATPPPKQATLPERQATPPVQVAPPASDDGEDTTASDQPYRYLALARREGFQVTTNSERAGAKGAETVWLLNEPEHGIQVTLVTSDVAVLEANLHFNMRMKDAAVLRATRPEHRDLDSATIYVRESCVEGLRAKCRRLRASGALQRDWKVTPRIYPPG